MEKNRGAGSGGEENEVEIRTVDTIQHVAIENSTCETDEELSREK